jgi:hypothetical protein
MSVKDLLKEAGRSPGLSLGSPEAILASKFGNLSMNDRSIPPPSLYAESRLSSSSGSRRCSKDRIFTPDLSQLNPNSTPDLSQLNPRTCHTGDRKTAPASAERAEIGRPVPRGRPAYATDGTSIALSTQTSRNLTENCYNNSRSPNKHLSSSHENSSRRRYEDDSYDSYDSYDSSDDYSSSSGSSWERSKRADRHSQQHICRRESVSRSGEHSQHSRGGREAERDRSSRGDPRSMYDSRDSREIHRGHGRAAIRYPLPPRSTQEPVDIVQLYSY